MNLKLCEKKKLHESVVTTQSLMCANRYFSGLQVWVQLNKLSVKRKFIKQLQQNTSFSYWDMTILLEFNWDMKFF